MILGSFESNHPEEYMLRYQNKNYRTEYKISSLGLDEPAKKVQKNIFKLNKCWLYI